MGMLIDFEYLSLPCYNDWHNFKWMFIGITTMIEKLLFTNDKTDSVTF